MDKVESSVTIKASVANGVVEMAIDFDLCDEINQEQMMFLASDALMAVYEQLPAKDASEDEAV
jgi:hypothetical protein